VINFTNIIARRLLKLEKLYYWTEKKFSVLDLLWRQYWS